MASSNVRVRFPPSPTGDPHVGNIRTAIYNWLFARHHGGAFVIRIEDTDRARMVEGSTEVLLESLRWLGVDWDEGPDTGGPHSPYVQSQRLDLYREHAEMLLDSGRAYRCFCSPQRLAEVRQEQARLKRPSGYDRRCRELGDAASRDGDAVPVVRFRMPMEGETAVDDLVRGRVSFDNRLVDDFVMLKSDGFPTYHLANVVDDHHMSISHVMRAEEWLSSVPRHLQLYAAFGWEPPRFAHLPIVLAPDRSKLGKRHGATSVSEYREMGYLPEALLNFLTLLGWSLDDRTEIFSHDDLKRHFTIERVGKSGAVFDAGKLEWMNGSYIRESTPEHLVESLLDFWRRYPPAEIPVLPDAARLLKIVPLIQVRIKTLRDAAPLIAFLFRERVECDAADLVQRGMDAEGTRSSLEAAHAGLAELSTFDCETIEGLLRSMARHLNVKAGQLFGSLRVATTGQKVAPPLFESIEVLGRERTLASIRHAIGQLETPSGRA